MNPRLLFLATFDIALSFCIGCRPPGKPTPADIVLRPREIKDFTVLYQQNCAGCHGDDGKGNSALALANPVYLAIADENTIRHVTGFGVHGSLMPAFAKSSGGTLTDEQVKILAAEMHKRWTKPLDATPPPYAPTEPGNVSRGAQAYATFCADCHGPKAQGTAKASSIVEGSFLALVSDQSLRTTIIAGRPDLGHPDWRHDSRNRTMTSQEVTDVVAWLVSHRKRDPGQPYPTNEQAKLDNK